MIVEIPDKNLELEFPDDMDQSQIASIIQRDVYGMEPPSFGRLAKKTGYAVRQGAGDVLSGFAAGAENAQRRQNEFGLGLREAVRRINPAAVSQERVPAFNADKAISSIRSAAGGMAMPERFQRPTTSGAYNFIEDAITGVAGSAPAMIATAVNPPAGIALMYEQILGGGYNKRVQAGADPDRAYIASALDAAAQAPLEYAGTILELGALKKMAGGKAIRYLRTVLQTSAAEGLEEGLQAIPEKIADIYAANPKKSNRELAKMAINEIASVKFAKEAGYQAAAGAVGGGLLGAGGGAVQSLRAPNIEVAQKDTVETRDNIADTILSDLQSNKVTPEELEVALPNLAPEQAQSVQSALATYRESLPPKRGRGLRPPRIQTVPKGEIKLPQPKSAQESAQVFEQAGQPRAEQAYDTFEREGVLKTAQERNQEIIDRTNVEAENEIAQNRFDKLQDFYDLAHEAGRRGDPIPELKSSLVGELTGDEQNELRDSYESGKHIQEILTKAGIQEDEEDARRIFEEQEPSGEEIPQGRVEPQGGIEEGENKRSNRVLVQTPQVSEQVGIKKEQISEVPPQASEPKAQPAPSPVAPSQKEPWEMSKDEWGKARESIRPSWHALSSPAKASVSKEVGRTRELKRLLYGVHDEASEKIKSAARGDIELSPDEVEALTDRLNTNVSHYDVVQKALSEGKPVPQEVLKDYPDLVTTQGQQETPNAPSPINGLERNGRRRMASAPGVEGEVDRRRTPRGTRERRISTPEKVTEQFNAQNEGSTVKFDGIQDLSSIGKPPLYQFTGKEGILKGASFSISDPTVETLKAKVDEMTQIWSKKQEKRGAIGRAWTGNQWKPITDQVEIKRGKNKGKMRVTFAGGKNRIVAPESIKPFEKTETKKESPTEKLKKKFKDQSGSSQIATDIINHGISLKQKGIESFRQFKSSMREKFSEVWDKIKVHMRELWGILSNQRGEIKIGQDDKSQDIINRYFKKVPEPKITEQKFAETKTGPVPYSKTIEPITEQDYIENRQQRRDVGLQAKTGLRRVMSEISEGTDKFLGAISTRLGNINPKLKAKLRILDFDINTKMADDIKAVESLLKKAKSTMTSHDFADWDYARKNSDTNKIKELVSKYNLKNEYDQYRKTLDKIRKEAIDVGLAIGEIEEYAPRVLKDSRGFLNAIGKEEDWPIYTRRLKEKANDLGISITDMSDDMKADIISNMILFGQTGLGGLRAEKQRKIQKIPPELNKFYMDSDAALVDHIYRMRKGIEARKFFGKIPEKVSKIRKQLRAAETKLRDVEAELKKEGLDEQTIQDLKKKRNRYYGNVKEFTDYIDKYAMQRDYRENIGQYVLELIENGDIKARDERAVNEILNARFHEKGTHGIINAYKNMSYIDTMGSPISALTQIGDLAWAAYDSGMIPTIKNALKALRGKSKITKEDVGVERIAQEFADASTLSRAVSFVFKMVQLERIDSIGKETLLNSALEKYQKQAKENPERLAKEVQYIFENETQQLITDLQEGKITDNVKLLVYNRLLDFQPVALSEMPEKYLNAGNGRIFYMLKTFTLKQFDAFRNEAYLKIKNGNRQEKIQGMKNLIRLAMFFVLANATADELKDFVLGRSTDWQDRLVDNALRLFGISKFITWQARTEGVGTAIAKQILPPFKFFNSATRDVVTAGDEKGLEIVSSIPLLGKFYYWHLGRGSSKRTDLWERRYKRIKSRLESIKNDYEETTDKRSFMDEHLSELRQSRKISKYQGRLNRLQKEINILKKRQKSNRNTERIEKLQEERIKLMRKFVESYKQASE